MQLRESMEEERKEGRKEGDNMTKGKENIDFLFVMPFRRPFGWGGDGEVKGGMDCGTECGRLAAVTRKVGGRSPSSFLRTLRGKKKKKEKNPFFFPPPLRSSGCCGERRRGR